MNGLSPWVVSRKFWMQQLNIWSRSVKSLFCLGDLLRDETGRASFLDLSLNSILWCWLNFSIFGQIAWLLKGLVCFFFSNVVSNWRLSKITSYTWLGQSQAYTRTSANSTSFLVLLKMNHSGPWADSHLVYRLVEEDSKWVTVAMIQSEA